MVSEKNTRISVTLSKKIAAEIKATATKSSSTSSKIAADIINHHYGVTILNDNTVTS